MGALNHFILNSGLQHLAEQILQNLDPKSLILCRQISKSTRDLIDTKKSLIIVQIQAIQFTKVQRTYLDSTNLDKFTTDDIQLLFDYIKQLCMDQKQIDYGQGRERERKRKRMRNTQEYRSILDPLEYYKYTVLHFACMNGRVDIVKLFLKYHDTQIIFKTSITSGPNSIVIASDNEQHGTPFNVACYNRQAEVVQAIVDYSIEHDVKINGKEGYTWIAVALAFAKGHPEITRILLGFPPLHPIFYRKGLEYLEIALQKRNLDNFKLILDHLKNSPKKYQRWNNPNEIAKVCRGYYGRQVAGIWVFPWNSRT